MSLTKTVRWRHLQLLTSMMESNDAPVVSIGSTGVCPSTSSAGDGVVVSIGSTGVCPSTSSAGDGVAPLCTARAAPLGVKNRGSAGGGGGVPVGIGMKTLGGVVAPLGVGATFHRWRNLELLSSMMESKDAPVVSIAG